MTDIEKLINGTQAEQIAVIERITRERLQLITGLETIPEQLEYIVTEVSIKRFNRIGSEGAQSHNVEGESLSWASNDDFNDYLDEIANYLNDNEGGSNFGRVRFI